jgi:O-antigen/teichoic acid export membrane protein
MNKVVQNYFFNLGYQLFTIVLPFLTIPYVTRVLGPKNLGIDSYTMSIITIFSALATAGTTVYATRLVARYRDLIDELNKKVYTLLLIRLILGLFIFLIFLIYTTLSEYKLFLIFQMVYLVSNTILDSTWYYAGMERFKEITTRNLFIKVVGFFLIILFVRDKNDIYLYMIINGVTLLIPNVYLMIKLLKEIGKPTSTIFSKRILLSSFHSLAPFFLMNLVIQLYNNLDNIVIEKYNLTYELGVYSQIIKSFTVFLSPITSIGTILMPYVSNLNANDDKNKIYNVVSFSSTAILIIGVPLFFGLLYVSKDFVEFYYGTGYIEYLNLFRLGCLLILTGCIYNIVIQQIVLPNLQEKIYVQGIAIAALVRLLVLLFTLNKVSIYGAVLAYLIGDVFIQCWCILKMRKTINILPLLWNQNNLKIFFSSLSMYIILVVFNANLLVSIPLGIVIYVLFIYFLKESTCMHLFSMIKNFERK